MVNFLDLPSELRNQVYKLCLLHQERIDPWNSCNPRQELTPGLLRANKTIHREASPLFYAQNCFDFTMATPRKVVLFLTKIGRKNADHIQHVYVNFPRLRDLEPGNVTIEEDDADIVIPIIQSGCANLSTLTMSLDSTDTMVFKLDALEYPKIVTEALIVVNTRLRAVSSQQNIVVEVYEDDASEYIKNKMRSHGWTVNAIKQVEELSSDSSFGWRDNYWDSSWLF